MVRWMRSARIQGGKYLEAIAWAKEMAGYAEKAYGASKVHVFLDAFGDIGTIRWSVVTGVW